MAEHVSQEQLDAQTDRLIREMAHGFARVDGHFERLNGRVRSSETAIAILTDRADRSTKRASALAAWVGGLIATLVSALVAWVSQR